MCDLIDFLESQVDNSSKSQVDNLESQVDFLRIENVELIQEYPLNSLEGCGLISTVGEILPPPLHNITKSEVYLKGILEKKEQKIKKVCEFYVSWKFSQELFSLEEGRNEEVMFNEVFSRY